MKHDAYLEAQYAQNNGFPCPFCGSEWGHYGVCKLLNPATAEASAFVAGDYTEEDRILARGLGVIL